MLEQNQHLQLNELKAPAKANNRPGFHNQGNIKAAGRGIILEALTAFKGGKVGKKGLLFGAMKNLEQALTSENALTREWATEQVLKLAVGMTKDDKSNPLEDLLKGAANVQINFNSHFSQRSGSDRQDLPGQGMTIGFTPVSPGNQAEGHSTPPPGSGEAGTSAEDGGG